MMLVMMACMTCLTISAQEIYNEVVRMMNNYEAQKNDTTKSINVRLLNTFKSDAIFYLISKASEDETFSELELGEQTRAMVLFVNLYIKRLAATRKVDERNTIKARFSNATLNNPLFNDVDKEVIHAYVGNERFLTQFSIDTDWKKALDAVK